MLSNKDIIQDGHPTLALKAKEVKLPLSNEDRSTIMSMLKYCFDSHNPELAEKHDLTPAAGIAAPQINISKRMFVVFAQVKNPMIGAFINPVIIEKSKEMVHLKGGEGCLSVDPSECGLVERYKWVKVRSHILDLQSGEVVEKTFKFDGYVGIVFQHEFDHLEGVLYNDKVNNDTKTKAVKV